MTHIDNSKLVKELFLASDANSLYLTTMRISNIPKQILRQHNSLLLHTVIFESLASDQVTGARPSAVKLQFTDTTTKVMHQTSNIGSDENAVVLPLPATEATNGIDVVPLTVPLMVSFRQFPSDIGQQKDLPTNLSVMCRSVDNHILFCKRVLLWFRVNTDVDA